MTKESTWDVNSEDDNILVLDTQDSDDKSELNVHRMPGVGDVVVVPCTPLKGDSCVPFDPSKLELDNLDRKVFIERVNVSCSCENDAISLREHLAEKVRSSSNGKSFASMNMHMRRSTKQADSMSKYINDCFSLQRFLDGESLSLEAVFCKSRESTAGCNSPRVSTSLSYRGMMNYSNDDIICLRAEIVELRNEHKTMQSKISSLESELEICKKAIADQKSDAKPSYAKVIENTGRVEPSIFVAHTSQLSPRDTCKKKHSENDIQPCDSLEIASENDSCTKTVECDDYRQSILTNLPKHKKKANKSQRRPSSQIQQQGETGHERHQHETHQVLTSQKASLCETDKSASLKMADTMYNKREHEVKNARAFPRYDDISNYAQIGDTIGNSNVLDAHANVRSRTNETNHASGNEHDSPSNDNDEWETFRGARRDKVRNCPFYVSGISKDVKLDDMSGYLRSRDVDIVHLRIFDSESKSVSAKLVVKLTKPAYRLHDRDFWPKGVRCRRWLSDAKWKHITTDNE